MKFGLSSNDYKFIKELLDKKLDKKSVVYCFGSRARGDYQKFSDLDLMVESSKDLSRELSQLKEEFEESRLPIKVDIVQLKDFANAYKANYENEKTLF